jgi:hypothetical protein
VCVHARARVCVCVREREREVSLVWDGSTIDQGWSRCWGRFRPSPAIYIHTYIVWDDRSKITWFLSYYNSEFVSGNTLHDLQLYSSFLFDHLSFYFILSLFLSLFIFLVLKYSVHRCNLLVMPFSKINSRKHRMKQSYINTECQILRQTIFCFWLITSLFIRGSFTLTFSLYFHGWCDFSVKALFHLNFVIF